MNKYENLYCRFFDSVTGGLVPVKLKKTPKGVVTRCEANVEGKIHPFFREGMPLVTLSVCSAMRNGGRGCTRHLTDKSSSALEVKQ